MKTFDCTQYSPEWWELRAGIPTASAFDRIITPAQWKKSAGARTYMCELAAEVAGYHLPNFFSNRENRPKSQAMLVGTNTEPEARRYYAMLTDSEPKQIGFCASNCWRFGCSPDALVEGDKEGPGGLELKCPEVKTHLQYLLDGELPAEYRPQVHGCLLVTGYPWWDFMSYAGPHVPPFHIRTYRDEMTLKLAHVLEEFQAEYMKIIDRLGIRENYTAADQHRRAA